MKKTLFLTLAVLASCILPAYHVVEVRNPVSGAGFTSGTMFGGKLVAVQAFSTNATGTVSLMTVYHAPIFTNGVRIASVTATNYVVVASNRVASLTREVYLRVPDGPPTISTNVYTHAVETNQLTKLVVTNLPNQVVFTNTFAAADGPITAEGWAASHPLETFLSISTNTTATTATNVWPVVKEYVTVTNTLVTGACTTNVYNGSPAADTYLKAHEWLIFEGTATGGFLRLILE